MICICPSEVQTNWMGRTGRNNPNKLYADDIAATIMAGARHAAPRAVARAGGVREQSVEGGLTVRLVRAGLLTALVDGLFSSVLAHFAYGSSVTRLFQGVAATLFGNGALERDAMAIVGVLMHIAVAFTWSAIFLIAYRRSAGLRRLVATRLGVVKTAAIYGPLVWVVMSSIVIPALTRRPPAITFRWWVQFVGHAMFVGLPIVSMISRSRTLLSEES